jgi:hypothetical protein
VQMLRVLTIFLLVLNISLVYATNGPKLNFTDLVNGPANGIGDGLGSGAIVTVWGQKLRGSETGSKIIFTDSSGNEHAPAFVYYWKNADGQKPSGVANLYKSHKMQEFSFSIPNVEVGMGSIHVQVNGIDSNKLPFLVRNGSIYHIKSNGSDANVGSFKAPLKTIKSALEQVTDAGSIIYVHDDIKTEDTTSGSVFYWTKTNAFSESNNHFGLISYPGSTPEIIGRSGIGGAFKASGLVISKFLVKTSDCEEGANGQPINCIPGNSFGIEGTRNGRVIGNALTDKDNGCANSEQAAIVSYQYKASGLVIYGNEIYEYGCKGSTKFQHTTYITIRNKDGIVIDPWELGWNYLHDNDAKNGLHNFDLVNGTTGFCGTANAAVKIHDNLVVNQAGAGIFVGARCEWSHDFEIYNNIIINSGLPADWDGIDPATSKDANTSGITINNFKFMESNVSIYNNSLFNWNKYNIQQAGRSCIALTGNFQTISVDVDSNLCVTEIDERFFYEQIEGGIFDAEAANNNAWFFTGNTDSPSSAIPPTISNSIVTDPLIDIDLPNLTYVVKNNSPLIQQSNTDLTYDFYGTERGENRTVGAVEFTVRPLPPSNVSIE